MRRIASARTRKLNTSERLARSLAAREKRLWTHYNLTLRQYGKMLADQDGKCKICGRVPKTKGLEVDHDHKTGRVRGLLDFHCNHRLLGRGLEDPDLHRKAATYLDDDFDGRLL